MRGRKGAPIKQTYETLQKSVNEMGKNNPNQSQVYYHISTRFLSQYISTPIPPEATLGHHEIPALTQLVTL